MQNTILKVQESQETLFKNKCFELGELRHKLETIRQKVAELEVLERDLNSELWDFIVGGEKPSFSNAPSNKASIGRYILTPDIFHQLKKTAFDLNKELQLADAINALAKKGRVESVAFNGERFDCGSLEGYLNAIFSAASKLNMLPKKYQLQ